MQHIVAQILYKLDQRVTRKVSIHSRLALLKTVRTRVVGPHKVASVLNQRLCSGDEVV